MSIRPTLNVDQTEKLRDAKSRRESLVARQLAQIGVFFEELNSRNQLRNQLRNQVVISRELAYDIETFKRDIINQWGENPPANPEEALLKALHCQFSLGAYEAHGGTSTGIAWSPKVPGAFMSATTYLGEVICSWKRTPQDEVMCSVSSWREKSTPFEVPSNLPPSDTSSQATNEGNVTSRCSENVVARQRWRKATFAVIKHLKWQRLSFQPFKRRKIFADSSDLALST